MANNIQKPDVLTPVGAAVQSLIIALLLWRTITVTLTYLNGYVANVFYECFISLEVEFRAT